MHTQQHPSTLAATTHQTALLSQERILKRNAMALALIALGSLTLVAPQIAFAQTTESQQSFSIPAGKLSDALAQFAATAGVPLSFDPQMLAGIKSAGLEGNYSVQGGFSILLAGTGYQLEDKGNGAYSLRKASAAITMLPAVKISDAAIQDGSADAGYVTQKVSQVGPWQGRTLQDTPFSVAVYSEELMQNLQATTPDQVYRLNPATQLVRPQHENNQPRIMMRGFSIQNSYRDGVPDDQYNHTATTEDAAQIEILTGLSGFLYGANNIGGVTNYTTKRSTEEQLSRITLSGLGNESWHTHGDFGGKFDSDGRFGYRVNLVEQGGDSAIEQQEIEKSFYSVALDGDILENLWLQVHGMTSSYDVNGSQTYWYFADGVSRPTASKIDNDISWGQPWTNRWYDYSRYGANLKWDAGSQLTIRAAYIENEGTRGSESTQNTLTSSSTYDQKINGVYAPGVNDLQSKQRDKGASIYADLIFDTASVAHKITVGVQYSDSQQFRMNGESAQSIALTGLSFTSPYVTSKPQDVALVDRGQLVTVLHRKFHNIVVGDDITFNDNWSALIGLAHTTLQTATYIWSPSEEGYKESAITPSVSLLYKPEENLTTYVSYIEALESGGAAGEEHNGAPVANAGEVFEPLISEQIEIGAKLDWMGLALNSALFRIEKGLQYYDVSNAATPRFVQDGKQIHQGIEFTVTGKLTENLSVLGGFTWLDAKVEEQKQSPELEGKQPADVADKLFKVRAEYAVPQVRNLSMSAAAIYNGASFGDTLNTDEVPSYTLFDLGARYEMDIAGILTSLRLDAHNVFNKHYWNGFNGTRIGDPRTLLLSVSVNL